MVVNTVVLARACTSMLSESAALAAWALCCHVHGAVHVYMLPSRTRAQHGQRYLGASRQAHADDTPHKWTDLCEDTNRLTKSVCVSATEFEHGTNTRHGNGSG